MSTLLLRCSTALRDLLDRPGSESLGITAYHQFLVAAETTLKAARFRDLTFRTVDGKLGRTSFQQHVSMTLFEVLGAESN